MGGKGGTVEEGEMIPSPGWRFQTLKGCVLEGMRLAGEGRGRSCGVATLEVPGDACQGQNAE